MFWNCRLFLSFFRAVAGMKMIKTYRFVCGNGLCPAPILLVWFLHLHWDFFRPNVQRQFIYPGGLTHPYHAGIMFVGWFLKSVCPVFRTAFANDNPSLLCLSEQWDYQYDSRHFIPISKEKKIPPQQPTMRTMIPVSNLKREEKKEYSNPQPAVVDFELEQPMKVEVGSKEEEVSTLHSLLRKTDEWASTPHAYRGKWKKRKTMTNLTLPYPMIHQRDAEYKGPAFAVL